MRLTSEEIVNRFPIHWLVWNNRHEELKTALVNKKFSQQDIERKDPRGRTPLLMAITLSHIQAVEALIEADADVNCEKDGWTAVQEATATGNIDLLSTVLSKRDYQRHVVRSSGIPELLNKLSLAPDFYVEMKWEFTSWVPLVSRMCPFDTYKVYKRGSSVRVDTTLVGFENNKWQRGDRTYIFKGQGRTASLVELDHEAQTCWREYLEGDGEEAEAEGEGGEQGAGGGSAGRWPPPPARVLRHRLAAPLVLNYLDTDKICFERTKSGIWGWRQDKCESVSGYECKVFSANNVELVSSTRTEHLPREGGDRRPRAPRAPRAPLAGLLALADDDGPPAAAPAAPASPASHPPSPAQEEPLLRSKSSEELVAVSLEEYFSDEPLDRDIGRPKEISTKVQKFKAMLWLCEDYPLQLQDQMMPILDLMAAISSPHFAKLKDFIQMQLPAGFPVKIEIPLFHVLNARITFSNIFAHECPAPHVRGGGGRGVCVVDEACFSVGRGYRDAAHAAASADDDLLHYAIQQSLMDAGTHDDQVDVWEALRGARSTTPVPPRALAQEDANLQRAIEASLADLYVAAHGGEVGVEVLGEVGGEVGGEVLGEGGGEEEAALAAALALSAREHAARGRQAEEEQRALDEVLRLSLLDK